MNPSYEKAAELNGSEPPTLEIENLTVAYLEGDEWLEAVREVSLQVKPGQVYGLVGESGSGKSTLALAVMGYLSEDGKVCRGRVRIEGKDIWAVTAPELREIWGSKLALVPQDPLSSLNPSLSVGEQIAEALRHHKGSTAQGAKDQTLRLFEKVQLPDPERVYRSYPHQISGGMQQRVMIAMALSADPCLLILDEPTTGLDVTTEAVILDLFRDIIRQQRTSTLYVSHNLGVVAQFSDRVAVLYASELVEDASTEDLYRIPIHPYTQGLLDSVPRLGENKRQIQLRALAGQIPSLRNLPGGCVFAPRCPLAIELCHTDRPRLEEPAQGHRVRCHRWPEILAGETQVGGAADTRRIERTRSEQLVLQARDAEVHFPVRRSIREALAKTSPRQVKAVDGVSFEVHRGDTLGIVGESGSGKTTLARAIVGLVDQRGGEIELLGMRLPERIHQRTQEMKRHLQMIFQNPREALNPYLSVEETLSRPFIRLQGLSRSAARQSAADLLQAVRLSNDYLAKLPSQLSGGERQRVAIGRAFAAQPDILIADEPVSALDVSVQAAILNLLNELQNQRRTSLVFISHDLAVVGFLADQVAVMYLGRWMQVSSAEAIFEPPYHPYTEALLSAVPLIDPQASQVDIRLTGDVPSAIELPSGCPFHPRCPRHLGEVCQEQDPPWRMGAGGERIYCHIPLDDLRELQRAPFRIEKRSC